MRKRRWDRTFAKRWPRRPIFDLKLTPIGRLPVRAGVAREVAALTARPYGAESTRLRPAAMRHCRCGQSMPRLRAFQRPRDPQRQCAAATPAWMKQRLERAGQRSISALVDVTNYVMLDWGGPCCL